LPAGVLHFTLFIFLFERKIMYGFVYNDRMLKGCLNLKRIESKKNPRVKEWKKLHTKKGRDKSGCFFIEGYHLIGEALKSDVEIIDLVIEEGTEIPAQWHDDRISFCEVTGGVMKDISDTETPQGVIAVCRKPKVSLPKNLRGQFLLIDGVQDPGNIGTMIRTADAAGLTAVILGKGCADPYNGKVLRATQGSLFHLPVEEGDLFEWVKEFKRQQVPVYGTALQGGKTYTDVFTNEYFALIVGNEGNGVDPALLKETDEKLYIPIHGHAESLNVSVAAGILLYGLRR
jgi:TrmH family RNA methyltransferase